MEFQWDEPRVTLIQLGPFHYTEILLIEFASTRMSDANIQELGSMLYPQLRAVPFDMVAMRAQTREVYDHYKRLMSRALGFRVIFNI